MSDNFDDLIGSALGEFHTDEATSAGPITSSGAIRATVAHRRKVRITSFSVLGALLIAVPIAAFAANPRGNNSPPIGSAASPTPTVSATAEPITAEELIAAKVAVDFGNYDCADVFGLKPSSHKAKAVYVEKLAHLNLDSDSDLETVVVASCNLYENSAWQVLGFDRDGTGKIVGMGKVTQGLSEHLHVDEIRPRVQGGLILITADIVDSQPTTWRARNYVWDGKKFAETTTLPQSEVTGPSISDIVKAKISLRSSEFACHKVVAKPKSFVDATQYVEKIVHTNLDDDPALETAAFIKCPRANGTSEWDVIALDRDSSGKVVFIGDLERSQIIYYHPTNYLVTDIEVRAAGGVVITLQFPGQGEQKREYAWKDGDFVQVGGPTSPPVS